MSLVHIRLNRIFNDEVTVSYQVESSDFSEKNCWNELGLLKSAKNKKSYEFISAQLAREHRLIPPEIYALSEKERQEELTSKYASYGCGAWSMCVHHWAKTLISNNDYPEIYP